MSERNKRNLVLIVFILCFFLISGCGGGSPKEDYAKSIGIEMVQIPAGSFVDTTKTRSDQPVKINISKDFYLSKHEITMAQWVAVMGGEKPKEKEQNLPMLGISYKDAKAFVKKLNENAKTDKYRLPTAAEWQYALKAGSTTKFFFGDDEKNFGDYAWYTENSGNKPRPVGQKKPNKWGLYDLYGNAREWVEDNYISKDLAGKPEVTDPVAKSADAKYGVLYGGSYSNVPEACLARYRTDYSNKLSHDIGIRLAKSK